MFTTIDTFADFIRRHLRLEVPVNPMLILNHLGIPVERETMHPMVDGLLVWLSEYEAVAVINKIQPPIRQQWTLMHEACHFILADYKSIGSMVHRPVMHRIVTGRKCPEERACDVLAAKIFMPKDIFISAYHDLKNNSQNRLAIMSNRFGVSKAAVKYRMNELGLPILEWEKLRTK